MVFRQWDPSFYEKASRCLWADTVEFTDLTPGCFGSVFAVSDKDKECVTVAEICGCGVYHGRHDGAFAFSFPFGGEDKAAALRMIGDYCPETSTPMRFYPVGETELVMLRGVFDGVITVPERTATTEAQCGSETFRTEMLDKVMKSLSGCRSRVTTGFNRQEFVL